MQRLVPFISSCLPQRTCMPQPVRLSRGIVLAITIAVPLFGPGGVRAQAVDELPLVGPAYEIATQAYEAFGRGDYTTAVVKSREAIRQRPDVSRLRRLLVDALAASGDLEEADRTASRFIQAGIKDPELVLQRDRLRERLAQRSASQVVQESQTPPPPAPQAEADDKLLSLPTEPIPLNTQQEPNPGFQAADLAYKAYARKDFTVAIEQARAAVRREPSNRDYRLLLVNTLAGGKRLQEAEQVATLALTDNRGDGEILAQRGYIRTALQRYAAATDDFAAALKARRAPVRDQRALRLALADAALNAKQPQRALEALQGLEDRPSYAVAARSGFALLALGQRERALDAFRDAAVQSTTGKEKATVTSAEIGLLVDLDRKDEARRRFAESKAALSPLSNLDLAYLASRVGDDKTAEQRFSRAHEEGQLRGTGYVDAAYVAKRLYRNDQAATWLKTAIDEAASGQLTLDPQYLFGLRREVGELERSWGAFASLLYGTVGVSPGVPIALTSMGRNVLQAGTEFYWRPPEIGYRDGTLFEIFGRVFQTLSDETNGPIGISSAQGSVGARWKPFSGFNLVLEASRLFPIGKFARTDGLLRVAYSDGRGTDLRVDVPNWWTWQIYGDLGYFVEEKQTVGTFEARAGHSFRSDGLSNRLVLTPFLAVGAGYDSLLATRAALGAGAGLNLRYWFRENKYTAPLSSIDFSIQYRAKLAGDDRAQGIFAGITLSY